MISLSRSAGTFFIIVLFFVLSAGSQQQSSSSSTGLAGSPMRMGFGARGTAMGNSMSSVIYGDVQSYYNPAVITFQTAPTATIAYSVLSLDRHLNFLSFTKSLKPNAGIALSIINAGVGNIDGRDRDGIHTDIYSTSENAFMLSFCLRPVRSFSLGITAKILYYVLFDEMKSSSAAVDIGAIYTLSPELTLAAVVQDINAKYNWNSTKLYGILGNDFSDRFPLRKRLGISWNPAWNHSIISGEYELIGSESFLRFGSEVEIIDAFQIRGGIDQIALQGEMAAKPAIGMAIQTNVAQWSSSFQYSYIFEPYSPSGMHIISLSLSFP